MRISKFQVALFFSSLGLDCYFIVTLAGALNPTTTESLGLAFAVVLLALDVTTLVSFYEGEQWHSFSKIPTAWVEGNHCSRMLPGHELKYRATSKLECYILVVFIMLLISFQGTVLDIVFALLDYVLVCLRLLLRLRMFASSESYDMRAVNKLEDPWPYSLVVFSLITVFDVISSVLYFPEALWKTLTQFWEMDRFPDFETGMVDAAGGISGVM